VLIINTLQQAAFFPSIYFVAFHDPINAMAPSLLPRKSTVVTFKFPVHVALIASPHILQNYHQTAAITSALAWTGQKFMPGIASLTFIIAVVTLWSKT
jgi:hypothetical protein